MLTRSIVEASAPGKILIAGEYSVLEGGIALVMAVDRRARAWIAQTPAGAGPTPFLAAARAVLAAELGSESAAARAAAHVQVDTRSMCAAGGEKLGLGSSAAATVAALAACLVADGRASVDRPLLHRLAHRAHGDAQAELATGPHAFGTAASPSRGSGADVAASVWGGVLLLQPVARGAEPPTVSPLSLPPELELVPVWTGRPADTRTLVAAVHGLATRDPAAYAACLARIADAAAGLVAACRPGSPAPARSAVAALDAGGRAVHDLGESAGVPLFLDCHHALAAAAASLGGALKPTGAAGGDVALAGFDSSECAQQFRAHVAALGMHTVDLRVDPVGAAVDPTQRDF